LKKTRRKILCSHKQGRIFSFEKTRRIITMNLLLTDAEAAAAGSTGASAITMVLMVVIWFVVIYFLMLRPQKKEQKKKAALINSVEVGDSILTTSGFYGIVIDVTDEDVIVEFGNNKNCRIPMKKAAIEQVEKPDAE
jgi:preprotein translocase subunit YajC